MLSLDPTCGKRPDCVEGQCVKNPFNFWEVNPRTPNDVTFTLM